MYSDFYTLLYFFVLFFLLLDQRKLMKKMEKKNDFTTSTPEQCPRQFWINNSPEFKYIKMGAIQSNVHRSHTGTIFSHITEK